MNKFTYSLSLFIIGCIASALGILFLLFNHVDTLYHYVPGSAENYLHIKPQSLNELTPAQKQEIIIWLSAHSTLDQEAWQQILSLNTRELGLYTLNGQIFGLVKKNHVTENFFNGSILKSVVTKKVIFFGGRVLGKEDLQSLAQSAWFKSVRQKILFKDFVFYSQNLKTLNLGLPTIKNAEIPLISLLGNIKDARVQASILGNVGQAKDKFITNGLSRLPASTIAYFRNLSLSNIDKFKTISTNLEFSILQKLPSNLEYFKDPAGSELKLPKDSITLERLKQVILDATAQIYPTRTEKILPDGSIAINLIANKQAWSFVEFSPKHWILPPITEDKTTPALIDLMETQNDYRITFGSPNFNGELESKCELPKFSQNGIIYYNLGLNSFENLLIQNKNQKKIKICID